MARIKLHTTTLLERLKCAAFAYFFAKEELGDEDSVTLDALDKLKEAAEHFAEEQHPLSVDENGDELTRDATPMSYSKLLTNLQASFDKDAAMLTLGAKKTTGV